MGTTRFNMTLPFSAGKGPFHWFLELFKIDLFVTKATPRLKDKTKPITQNPEYTMVIGQVFNQ